MHGAAIVKGPSGSQKPKNLKQTVKRLVQYYHDYKSKFIITVILGFTAALLSSGAIFIVGLIYDMYIVNDNAFVDGISAFVGICVGLIIMYIIMNTFQ